MQNSLILFVFIFVNLFFPISPYLVMVVDCMFAFYYGKGWRRLFYNRIVFFTLILLFFAFFAAFFTNKQIEQDVLFKYIRTALSGIFVLLSCNALKDVKISNLLKVLDVIMILHPAMIILQLIFPSLSILIAPYFNFSRDIEMLDAMLIRKLGLSGGFDAASMLLCSGMAYYYYRFIQTHNFFPFFAALISFVLTVFVSRFGLLVGLGLMGYFALISIKKNNRTQVRLVGLIMIMLGALIFINIIIPILAATNSLFFKVDSVVDNDISFFIQDYSSANGSLDNLMGSHLSELNSYGFFDILYGTSTSSNSDIGYIQMISQIGLLGGGLILFFHFQMIFRLVMIGNKIPDYDILCKFLVMYIILLFIFNCKILLLYSRGFFEFLLIGYLYIEFRYEKILLNE